MSSSQAPHQRSRGGSARGTPRGPSGGGNRSTGPSRGPAPREPAETGGALAASVLGFAAAACIAGAIAWSSGCSEGPPPGARTDLPSRVTSLPAPPPSEAPPAPSAAPVATLDAGAVADAAVEDEKPYTGPLLGALALQTPVYAKPEFSDKRLGYIRLGSKVPVDPIPVKKGGKCAPGWYRLLDGGYVCGKYATLDMKNPQVRLGISAPNLDELLPYKYAYNTAHGTPLYRSVPSKDEMILYEPYLEASKKARRKAQREEERESERAKNEGGNAQVANAVDAGAPSVLPASAEEAADVADRASAMAAAAAIGILDGGTPSVEEDVPAPDKPWWQQQPTEGKSLSVKLSDLDSDSDSTVAKRMVKGFFVAVDKTFGWNGRQWYKTTAGLVAPADRMYIAKPPTSQGIAVPDGVKQVGFITSSKASKYELDAERTKVKVLEKVPRFTAFGLTGETFSHKTVIYRETSEGWWMKGIDGTYAEAGDRPAEIAPGEKWIDVNLSRKTLVTMEGDEPVFATLVSTGKRSSNKKKDHATIKGTFRIREKHITATMDGDGAAAEDLPYSIEDVPFVSYFEGSYALHTAFWHSNFGREMSHGCVNLSPLDAKHVFFWAGPALPRGWHGVWATAENRGTLVVVHD